MKTVQSGPCDRAPRTGCIIADQGGRPVYFHAPPDLMIRPGQRVTYEVLEGPDGKLYAVNLRLEDDAPTLP